MEPINSDNLPPVTPVSPTMPTMPDPSAPPVPEATSTMQAPPLVTPPSDTSGTESKKKIFLVIGALLVILLLTAVGIFAFTRMQTPDSDKMVAEATPTPSISSEWKTYEDQTIMISVPSNWTVTALEEEYYMAGVENANLVEVLSISQWSQQNASMLSASDLEAYLLDIYSTPCEDDKTWNVSIEKHANINGKEALSVKGTCGEDDSINSVFVLEGSGTVIQFGIGSGEAADLEVVKKIIESFEFSGSSGESANQNTFTAPAGWISHEYDEVSLTVNTPNDWDTSIEAFPENPSTLIRFWKKETPSVVPIQLNIKNSFANTGGDADYLEWDFEIADGIKAAVAEPPKKEDQTLERYLSLYYFERNGKYYVMDCTHNWEQDTIDTCENILKYLKFN